MGHDHAHHAHVVGGGADVRRALTWALALNGAFLLIEAGVGWATGSLALLSDAAHMLSDVGALALALAAAHLARKASTSRRTYGLRRAETMGAFLNGIALLVAIGWIVKEALQRLIAAPPAVPGWPVLLVGLAGLLVNLGAVFALRNADRENLNIRGAIVHMLADAAGSVGAMLAAVLILLGWSYADPLISLFIAVLVFWGSWSLIRDAGRILLQFAPPDLDVDRLRASLAAVPGVSGVHDLHVWTLDGQHTVLSAHLEAGDQDTSDQVRRAAVEMLHNDYSITHATLQIEHGDDCDGGACDDWHPAHP